MPSFGQRRPVDGRKYRALEFYEWLRKLKRSSQELMVEMDLSVEADPELLSR